MENATQSSSQSSRPAYPTTPPFESDLQFITAYLTVHVLTDPSRVYTYILWIALAASLVAASLAHHFSLNGGYLTAVWNKWALRRRTWRKKHSLAVAKAKGQPHKQPYSLPSNAQIFTLILILVGSLALAFVGPDYFAPGASLFTLHDFPSATATKAIANAKRSAYDPSAFLQFQPQYTIPKAWWSSGNRTGLIAFALFPLCVLFALKSPPFGIFSLPFLIQLYCDKLLWLHKCTAYLIYLLTLLHVAFWSVQLCIERRPENGQIVYTFAWQYDKFLYAWTAFGCMSILFVLSIAPFRKRHYEAFWFLHVLFVPLTLVMAALHHPPVGWWCWAALGLWIGERTWRFTWWLYTNGFMGGKAPAPSNKYRKVQTRRSGFQSPSPGFSKDRVYPFTYIPAPGSSANLAIYPPISSLPGVGLSVPTDYVPPPGFAHAELLPGRTIRLRIVTPGYVAWAPGQHFLVSIPAITRFTTHPFTTASICDDQNAYDDGRVLVLLIRAKCGWTKDLWDMVAMMISRQQQYVRGEAVPRCEMPRRGVLLRTCVDGPFGSSARASWGSYSSLLIIAGGSGVSFALSVLQYICLCLAGRDGRFLGGRRGGYGQPGFKTTRVRFVWLVREFGHIQWCASVLRRCMEMVPSAELQIDIFVTNVRPQADLAPPERRSAPFPWPPTRTEVLGPPTPDFVVKARPQSAASFTSDESGADSEVDLSYYTNFVHDGGELGHEEHVLDLTNFEGDDDTSMPGEAQFSLSIKREGRTRRAHSRRTSLALLAKEQLDYRASHMDLYRTSRAGFGGSPGQSSVQLVDKRTALPPIDTAISTPRTSFDRPSSQRRSMDTGVARRSADLRRSHLQRAPPPHTPPLATPNSAHPLLGGHTDGDYYSYDDGRPGSPRRPKRASHVSERSLMSPTTETTTHSPRTASRLSHWTDSENFAALVPHGEVESVRAQLRLDLDDREVEDVGIVAEHARPGKPKLDRILADEVERAMGAVAVACCGPTSLDAVVRKIVAAQIDPGRIRRGDMRGSISLFSEEFSY